jgi:hypothetical protein
MATVGPGDESRRLSADAASPDWEARARAGCGLAHRADEPEAAAVLDRLLRDPEDTAVVRRTAEALVRAGTPAAVRLVAHALRTADAQTADWIAIGITDAQDADWLGGAETSGGHPDRGDVAELLDAVAGEFSAVARALDAAEGEGRV